VPYWTAELDHSSTQHFLISRPYFQEFSWSFYIFQEVNWIPGVFRSSGHPAFKEMIFWTYRLGVCISTVTNAIWHKYNSTNWQQTIHLTDKLPNFFLTFFKFQHNFLIVCDFAWLPLKTYFFTDFSWPYEPCVTSIFCLHLHCGFVHIIKKLLELECRKDRRSPYQ